MLVQEVAPGVYAATELVGANVGLINTGRGAVLVDAPMMPSQARAWRLEIERLAPGEVAYMVDTDYHLDHVIGACYLPPALTIAHESAWKHLKALDPQVAAERVLEQQPLHAADVAAQFADLRIVQPQLTVGKAMTLWCDDRRIDLLHFGGHTAATLAVYVPGERVLFSGDLVVNGCHPYAGDASAKQWLAALEMMRKLEIGTIVPGHGQPGGPELIEPVYNYLKELQARVEACFQAGHTRRETVERVKLLDAFPVAPGDEERLRRMLRSSVERFYDEIKKEVLRNRQRA